VFPDTARRTGELVRGNLDAGAYDSITDFDTLISRLTEDLQSISHDRHIKLYRYQQHPAWGEADSIAQRDQELRELKRENFGFPSVDILPGNIGYVNITQFYDPRHAGPTATAAMNFLANSDALIIDLRENGGGYSTMKGLICSYLFEAPTHLMDFYNRDGISEQDWTVPFVSGARMTSIPVYVLTSRLTFSAGEGTAFALKNRGRAKVIGERTAGGAHAVEYFHFPEESLTVRVPTSRAVDPLTRTNWGGRGVEPDIQGASDRALIVANIEALKQLLSKESDDGQRYLLQWALDDYQNQLNPIVLKPSRLSEYVGDYGADRVTLESGSLYYYRQNRSKKEIAPMGNDGFIISDPKGHSKYRIQFIRNSSGRVNGFYIHDCDGDKYPVTERTRPK
jgi:hypothetical protein